jgi:hypothetical protein
VLWHVDLLPGDDSEIGDCTAAVPRQRTANNNSTMVFFARSAKQQMNSNGLTVFSERSVPGFYKQDKSKSSVSEVE